MKKTLAIIIFSASTIASLAHAQSTEHKKTECKKIVWSILQADETMGITSKKTGSNSELVAALREQKTPECEIKKILQKNWACSNNPR